MSEKIFDEDEVKLDSNIAFGPDINIPSGTDMKFNVDFSSDFDFNSDFSFDKVEEKQETVEPKVTETVEPKVTETVEPKVTETLEETKRVEEKKEVEFTKISDLSNIDMNLGFGGVSIIETPETPDFGGISDMKDMPDFSKIVDLDSDFTKLEVEKEKTLEIQPEVVAEVKAEAEPEEVVEIEPKVEESNTDIPNFSNIDIPDFSNVEIPDFSNAEVSDVDKKENDFGSSFEAKESIAHYPVQAEDKEIKSFDMTKTIVYPHLLLESESSLPEYKIRVLKNSLEELPYIFTGLQEGYLEVVLKIPDMTIILGQIHTNNLRSVLQSKLFEDMDKSIWLSENDVVKGSMMFAFCTSVLY